MRGVCSGVPQSKDFVLRDIILLGVKSNYLWVSRIESGTWTCPFPSFEREVIHDSLKGTVFNFRRGHRFLNSRWNKHY